MAKNTRSEIFGDLLELLSETHRKDFRSHGDAVDRHIRCLQLWNASPWEARSLSDSGLSDRVLVEALGFRISNRLASDIVEHLDDTE